MTPTELARLRAEAEQGLDMLMGRSRLLAMKCAEPIRAYIAALEAQVAADGWRQITATEPAEGEECEIMLVYHASLYRGVWLRNKSGAPPRLFRPLPDPPETRARHASSTQKCSQVIKIDT